MQCVMQRTLAAENEECKFLLLCDFYNKLINAQSIIFCNTKSKVIQIEYYKIFILYYIIYLITYFLYRK